MVFVLRFNFLYLVFNFLIVSYLFFFISLLLNCHSPASVLLPCLFSSPGKCLSLPSPPLPKTRHSTSLCFFPITLLTALIILPHFHRGRTRCWLYRQPPFRSLITNVPSYPAPPPNNPAIPLPSPLESEKQYWCRLETVRKAYSDGGRGEDRAHQ